MLRDLVNKGREIADKMTNMVLNFTEAESKVREATSEEAWGPHGQLMQQIAEYTYSHGTYLEVMCTLWRRMHVENARSWRRVYKSLLLLDFLLKNGSEHVSSGAREHIYDIRTLESFQYYDDYGKDQGVNVRIKVQEVINLIQDPERLKSERAKAKANRNVYSGYSNSDNMGWGNSLHQTRESYGSRGQEDFDDYHFKSDSRVSKHHVSQSSSSLSRDEQPKKLGNFDDWKVGRERGMVDDVVEQLKEAWDITKMTTKDIIFRQDSDAHVSEHNPRMVSEELYEFPHDAAEVDGTIDSGNWASNHVSGSWDSGSTRSSATVNNATRRSEEPRQVRTVEKSIPTKSKPRPPSVEITPTSWGSESAAVAPAPPSVPQTPIDLLSFGAEFNADTSWPTVNPSQPAASTNSLWPESNVTATSIGAGSVGSSLLDAEFSAFVSAPAQPLSMNKVGVAAHSTAPPLSNSGAAAHTAIPDTFDWMTSTTSSDLFASTVQPRSAMPVPQPQVTMQHQMSHPIVSNSTMAQQQQHQPTTTTQVGSTWKELGSLGINLDALAMPAKMGSSRQGAGPSLRQLQRQATTEPASPTSPAHLSNMVSTTRVAQQSVFHNHAGPNQPTAFRSDQHGTVLGNGSGSTRPTVQPVRDFSLI